MSTYIAHGKTMVFNVSSLDAPSFLKEYLNYQFAIRNLAPNTVNTYYIQLREFLRWTQVRYDPHITVEQFLTVRIAGIPFSVLEDIGQTDVYEFLSFSASFLGNSASSRSLKITVLNKFFEYYTVNSPRLQSNPLKGIGAPRKEKHLPHYLSLEQSLHVLQTAKEGQSSFPERDYCILTLFLNCGMRLSELVTIDVSNVREDTVTIYGKGRKERVLPLNDACKAALADYMPARSAVPGSEDEPALFLSKRRHTRISRRRVQQIVESAFQRAGYSGMGFSTHKLRHTAATLMYQYGGVDVMALQEVLGHQSVGTTQIYTHINPEQVKKAVESSPLANYIPNTDGTGEK